MAGVGCPGGQELRHLGYSRQVDPPAAQAGRGAGSHRDGGRRLRALALRARSAGLSPARQLRAADRHPRLCRRRPAARRVRRRAPHLRADRHRAAAGHPRLHRGRGQVVLRASRRRLPRHPARRRHQLPEHGRRQAARGRLDHHPAGGEELPPDQRGLGRAQDQGDAPRLPHRAHLHQAADPRALSQRDLPRRRLLRRRRGGAVLFQQVARRADPRRGGVPRRAAQGAQPLQPGAQLRRRGRAAQLRHRPHGRGRLHHARAGPGGGAPSRSSSIQRDAVQDVHADYFVEEVRRELLERFGEDKLLARRPVGALDARSEAPGDRAIAPCARA